MAGLSVRSLKIFDAIITTGTLGAAARLLNTSQSAASRQLLELERDIGLSLFERTNRQLKPTPEGLRFHSEIQHVLHGLAEIPAMVETIKSEERETLSVICMPRLSLGLLPRAQRLYSQGQQSDTVQTSVLRRNDIQRWAASRPFDIGLGMLPLDHQALVTEPLVRVRAGILVRDKHPLANRDQVSPKDLITTPCIGYLPGLMVREQIDQIFRDADIRPQFASETSSSLLACQLAVQGIGAAIIDCVAACDVLAQNSMRFIPLAPETWWRIGAFRLKTGKTNTRSESFVHAARDALQEIADSSPEGAIEFL
ncbi:putative LysR-family transcriptional regulator [Rhodobacteraceae bacterium KLH11]|nr:putative LysR-family transcriptional regulator [Rhodobacteraceae bacterium KLH11]